MDVSILIAIAVLLFAFLTFFAIRTLIAMRASLLRLDHTLMEVERKMHHIDPILRSLSNIGDVCEQKTYLLKQEFAGSSTTDDHLSEHLAEWLLLSIALGKKILNRR